MPACFSFSGARAAVLTVVLILLCFSTFSQNVKSTNIQTISGKKYYIHVVQKGQSLYAISKLYSVDMNYILADNDEALEGLKSGQELKIRLPDQPAATPVAPAMDTNKYVYHRVSKGETLYAILKKYNKTEQKLQELNPGLNANIREGQYIVVGEKNNKTKPYVPVVKKDTVLTLSDTTKFQKPKKTAYQVGLFLPFKLGESETISSADLAKANMPFPLLQSISVDFYLGFKKAVDSLSAKNFDVSIKLFDLEERDSARAEALCRSFEFKNLDMVVGPLYTSAFKIVSTNARNAGIPIISPLTQQSKILYNNPYVSKVTPSLFTLLEGLAGYCVDSLAAGNNILVVNDGSAKDLQYLRSFKKYYNDKLLANGKTLKDSIREVKGLAGVKTAFVPNTKNVLVLLTNNQVFLADFITQLYVYSEKKDLVLLGFSSVSEIENLDQEYLNKLQFTFATAGNTNYTDTLTMRLTRSYQSLMNTDPTDYFYEAFDIGHYFLSHLKNQGPSFFFQLDKYKAQGVSTKFNFYRPDTSTGFENRSVYIFRYKDYRLWQAGWKN